ncbi:uncharacterized protein LOC128552411 [Mercenaria mercenaria]|uniref:uncharacterized protein LOC128552411 n=1 Tax=Mercenaria mercenaria TaxID=6596 RepID=UPI00234F8A16|nr:uncharacterized protein LOC128552411 [Mercenaria mercenaria]
MFEQKNKEWERKLKESEDSIEIMKRVQKQKIEQYEKDIKKQKLKVKGLEELMEKSKFSFGDIGKLRKKLDETEKQLHDTNDRLVRVSSKPKETEKELDDTKTRLNNSIGAKLTDNNPNIADLSDTYRPTKLAERYTELYDNQWTDAFEQIQKEVHSDSDEEIINILLQILLDISDFCNRRAKKQMDDLKKTILCSDSMDDGSVPDYVTKQLENCRKEMFSVTKDHVFELYLSNLRNERGQPNYALRITFFVKECIQICWLMAIQEPPVVFASRGKGELYNTEMYKPYTKNGKYVKFIVWPAMLLHKDGHVLAKGVAQGERGKQGNDKVAIDSVDVLNIEKHVPHAENKISAEIGKERHQRAKSAEERRFEQPALTKMSSTETKLIWRPYKEYDRNPTHEEMRTYFYYFDRREYSKAREVLGSKVYIRCMQNEHKRHVRYQPPPQP